MAEKLAKLKKAELVALGEHLSVATDGLRSDVESRLVAFVETQGGLKALVETGKLTDVKLISLLALDPPTPKLKTSASSSSLNAKPVSKKPVAVKKSEEPSAWGEIAHEIFIHSPVKAYSFLVDHVFSHPGVKNFFYDLRGKLSTTESLILVLLYVEFFYLAYSQVGWQSTPFVSLSVPDALTKFATFFGFHFGQKLQFFLPIFSGLLDRKDFLYPAFYWFVYFVTIPSIAGWLINLQITSSRIKNEHVCPVNMLSFSLARLLIFYWVLKSATFDGLLVGAPVVTCHRSLTVLFDGHHLCLKLFLSTAFSGIVYSLYEKK